MDMGKPDACKTYIEQTKLLVALSSAFLVAPPVVISHSWNNFSLYHGFLAFFFGAEFMFIASILAGYVVLGTIAGSQDEGTYDVFRTATRISSGLQLMLYLGGLVSFVILVVKAMHF